MILNKKNVVTVVHKPVTPDTLYSSVPEPERSVMLKAMRCRLCEHPSCARGGRADIRGIMRRASVGNFTGAGKRLLETADGEDDFLAYEDTCVLKQESAAPVSIREVTDFIRKRHADDI